MSVIRRDGTVEIRVMSAGWGSSGYYPAEVLERDGPRVFGKGTKMFIDHPTPTEESQRPERSIRDLAAELVSNARWVPDHPKGVGLYADAKVFQPFHPLVEELAPHIGVSIRAMGKAKQGEIAGRKGLIVQELTDAKSIDIVTSPGANGRIIQMFEAARDRNLVTVDVQEDSVETKQLQEAVTSLEEKVTTLLQENARLKEGALLRDARDFVRATIVTANVPDVTKERLVESLSKNPPVKDGQLDTATFATQIQEAVKAEMDYLTKAAGYGSGRIEGMGGGAASGYQERKPEEIQADMAQAFQDLGFSESAAKSAATARGW